MGRNVYKHLISISDLKNEELELVLSNAQSFAEIAERDIKKVPSLRGKTIINYFSEPSTRTRSSFEIAGKWLSADVINVGGSSSSEVKGETLLDTARTLQAMSPDVVVVRHKSSGALHFLRRNLSNCALANAGDGMNEHPTQALLDILSIRQAFKSAGRENKPYRLAIVGDVLHSRVARSNILAHLQLGCEVVLVGPPTLCPAAFAAERAFGPGVKVVHSLKEGLRNADVVMCLRLQLERQDQNFIPSLEEYTAEFFVSEKVIAEVCPQALVMHPGPVNRGVEVETRLIDGPRSLMLKQVANGVAVRMAVLFSLATGFAEQVEV